MFAHSAINTAKHALYCSQGVFPGLSYPCYDNKIPHMSNLEQAAKNRREIADIKQRYVTGKIDRNEAQRLAKPVLGIINEATARKTAELNRKYNLRRKPALLSFVNAMRNEY